MNMLHTRFKKIETPPHIKCTVNYSSGKATKVSSMEIVTGIVSQNAQEGCLLCGSVRSGLPYC